MIIEIDKDSGFCFGVENSIQLAEKELAKGNKLYCLGAIVHNEEENRRLEALGVEFIDLNQFQQLINAKVLIRAHGEPPSTYAIARKNKIKLIDSTCAIVERLQHKIVCSYEEMLAKGGQVVVYGNKKHPEVIGLVGQTNGQAKVVSSIQDLDVIDYTKPVQLFSQTTKSEADYNAIEKEIKHRLVANGLQPDLAFKGKNTICKQVSKRGPHMKMFAKRFDMILFVTGKQSSNGKLLSETCKSVNKNTFVISSVNELQKKWFEGIASVGVTGATSTPVWMLEQIADEVWKMFD
ncbi:MAG: 4-hydroxy-3-methylbut-2-enyl diphosphate reductase [Bacteroidetes bacterium]|nr:4-hydroxy-3-methylbut-2-enyl diphosphate reductase [Bacteroidota bacterium]